MCGTEKIESEQNDCAGFVHFLCGSMNFLEHKSGAPLFEQSKECRIAQLEQTLADVMYHGKCKTNKRSEYCAFIAKRGLETKGFRYR